MRADPPPAAAHPPSLRRRVLFAVVAVAAGLLALEGIARLVEASAPQRRYPVPSGVHDEAFLRELDASRKRSGVSMSAEDTRGWALTPGTTTCLGGDLPLRINSLGMRGPEPAAPAPGEVRLLSLGDSSGFGHGVAEAEVFTAVAAAALAERWGRPVTPLNGCTPGYDVRQSLETLRLIGPYLRPSWVVVTCLWSDVYSPRPGAREGDVGGVGRASRRLALVRVLERALAPWTRARRVRWIAARDDVGAAADGADSRVDLAGYVDGLDAIAALTGRLGARPLFVALPAPVDLDDVAPPAAVAEYRAAMRLVAERHGAPLLDGPAALVADGGGLAHFLDQVHPSASGHALLGSALAGQIAAEGPPASPGPGYRAAEAGLLTDTPPREPLPFRERVPDCRSARSAPEPDEVLGPLPSP